MAVRYGSQQRHSEASQKPLQTFAGVSTSEAAENVHPKLQRTPLKLRQVYYSKLNEVSSRDLVKRMWLHQNSKMPPLKLCY